MNANASPPAAKQNGSFRNSTVPPKRPGVIATWKTLTKLKLTSMATLPAVLVFLAAPSGGESRIAPTLLLMLGVFASASGAAALNQWTERHSDTRMNRTRLRPLPAGHLSPLTVLLIGLALTGGGVALLGLFFNVFAASLALAAAAIYWLVYTPLKKVTPWCTEIGAVAGALPPLIGWAAAQGNLSLFAWFLFAILFLWQMPHFHPIAWRYRTDYARAGLQMRAVTEPSGNEAADHSIFYASLLFTATTLLFVSGETGTVSLGVTGVMNVAFIVHTIQFRFAPDRGIAARRLFRFSLIYLPVVLATITAERFLQHV